MLAWLKLRNTWVAVIAFLLATVPWYAYRFLGSAQFASSQENLLGTGGWEGWRSLWEWVFKQWFWMLSPLVFALAVAGVSFDESGDLTRAT